MQKNLERSGSQMMIKKLIEEKQKTKILQKHMTVKEENSKLRLLFIMHGRKQA